MGSGHLWAQAALGSGASAKSEAARNLQQVSGSFVCTFAYTKVAGSFSSTRRSPASSSATTLALVAPAAFLRHEDRRQFRLHLRLHQSRRQHFRLHEDRRQQFRCTRRSPAGSFAPLFTPRSPAAFRLHEDRRQAATLRPLRWSLRRRFVYTKIAGSVVCTCGYTKVAAAF